MVKETGTMLWHERETNRGSCFLVYNFLSSLLYLVPFTVLYLNLSFAVGCHISSAAFYQLWLKIIILALSFHPMCIGRTWQWHDTWLLILKKILNCGLVAFLFNMIFNTLVWQGYIMSCLAVSCDIFLNLKPRLWNIFIGSLFLIQILEFNMILHLCCHSCILLDCYSFLVWSLIAFLTIFISSFSENTKNVLIAACFIHLKHREHAKYTTDLTTINPRILLSGPAGVCELHYCSPISFLFQWFCFGFDFLPFLTHCFSQLPFFCRVRNISGDVGKSTCETLWS